MSGRPSVAALKPPIDLSPRAATEFTSQRTGTLKAFAKQIRELPCHHLAVTCCCANVSVFLLYELTLGGILVRGALSVAGVLAQPIALLLETAQGAICRGGSP
jgi:hypothetical protein